MASETRAGRTKAGAAFTLVELLLTVALMLLLAGAVILNFGSLGSHARLEEGASQVETLFRYARAQAADRGRQVKIIFGAAAPLTGTTAPSTNSAPSLSGTNVGVQLLWEPDPVAAPGRFEALPGAEMLVDQVNDLVEVREVGQPGATPTEAADFDLAAAPLPFSQTGNTNDIASTEAEAVTVPPLICYPDGSSDSMQVTLAAVGGDDKRLAVVTLLGLSGASRQRLITPAVDGVSQFGERGPSDSGSDR